MAMFDPYYVSSVLEDILSRETGMEWKFVLTPKEPAEAPLDRDTETA